MRSRVYTVNALTDLDSASREIQTEIDSHRRELHRQIDFLSQHEIDTEFLSGQSRKFHHSLRCLLEGPSS